jgi:pimeloyl-ACP methyl ester carboxylesterase
MKPETKQTVTIDDHQLAYYKLGHGQPLLFLHGGRVRALTFRKVIAQLSKEYTVIAPDIPGYGDSETPKGMWSFTEYADFFDSFLRKLKIDNATVMGYSMGGGIAFSLAARSDRVSQLILIDAAGLPLLNTQQNHHDMRRLRFYLTHPQYFSTFRTLIADFSRFTWKHRRDWRHMKAIRHHCFVTSYTAILKHVTIPTTIIWGQDDWILPVEIVQNFKTNIPQADIQIVSGNHDWILYDPLRLVNKMLKLTSKS